MAECIERDVVMKRIMAAKWMDGYDGAMAMEIAASAPTADVAPVVHGQWETNSDRPDSLICPVCKCGFDMWKHDPHNFCPNCGAKMDGGDGDAAD